MSLTCHAGGVVIYKSKSYQADNYAKVATYKSFKNYQATTVFYLDNGKTLEFNNYIWRKVIPFEPTENFNITEAYIIDRLSDAKDAYSEAQKQFPQANEQLKVEIAKIDIILDNWNKGKVRVNNTWLTDSELKLQVAQIEKARLAREEAIKEQLAHAEAEIAAAKREEREQELNQQREDINRQLTKLKAEQSILQNEAETIFFDYKIARDKLKKNIAKIDETLEAKAK